MHPLITQRLMKYADLKVLIDKSRHLFEVSVTFQFQSESFLKQVCQPYSWDVYELVMTSSEKAERRDG